MTGENMKSHKSIIASLIIFLSVIYLAGCATRPPPLPEELPQEEGIRIPQDESFDPQTLEEEEIIRLPESSLKPAPAGTIPGSSAIKTEPAFGMVKVPGFRVQLFSTDLEFEARMVEEKALIEFEESIYLIFDSPIYKVRVGDCTTRAEANKLRQKAVDVGFSDAWVVQSKVTPSDTR